MLKGATPSGSCEIHKITVNVLLVEVCWKFLVHHGIHVLVVFTFLIASLPNYIGETKRLYQQRGPEPRAGGALGGSPLGVLAVLGSAVRSRGGVLGCEAQGPVTTLQAVTKMALLFFDESLNEAFSCFCQFPFLGLDLQKKPPAGIP